MLHNPPLLTIHRGFPRPDPKLVEAFKGAQTSHLCDAMDGRGALDYRIKPLDPSQSVFAGPAMMHPEPVLCTLPSIQDPGSAGARNGTLGSTSGLETKNPSLENARCTEFIFGSDSPFSGSTKSVSVKIDSM